MPILHVRVVPRHEMIYIRVGASKPLVGSGNLRIWVSLDFLRRSVASADIKDTVTPECEKTKGDGFLALDIL